MALPWQREVVEELIDEIKNHENERSSIEMESAIDLIYKEQKGKKTTLIRITHRSLQYDAFIKKEGIQSKKNIPIKNAKMGSIIFLKK